MHPNDDTARALLAELRKRGWDIDDDPASVREAREALAAVLANGGATGRQAERLRSRAAWADRAREAERVEAGLDPSLPVAPQPGLPVG